MSTRVAIGALILITGVLLSPLGSTLGFLLGQFVPALDNLLLRLPLLYILGGAVWLVASRFKAVKGPIAIIAAALLFELGLIRYGAVLVGFILGPDIGIILSFILGPVILMGIGILILIGGVRRSGRNQQA